MQGQRSGLKFVRFAVCFSTENGLYSALFRVNFPSPPISDVMPCQNRNTIT